MNRQVVFWPVLFVIMILTVIAAVIHPLFSIFGVTLGAVAGILHADKTRDMTHVKPEEKP